MQAFQRLHAGFLVHTHDVRANRGKRRRGAVDIADPLDIRLVLFGGFTLVPRGKPVLAFVRSQVRSAKKRSTCRGEMLSTMPLLIASRDSSAGVQCDTGSPLSEGGSQASAIIPAICSAPNFAGAPLRAASVKIPRTNFSKSRSFAPAVSAARNEAIPFAQRCRHRRTRWRSMPSSLACDSLCRPAADNSTTRQRSTNCCADFLVRMNPSRIALCRGVTAMATDLLPINDSNSKDRFTMIPVRSTRKRLVTSAANI